MMTGGWGDKLRESGIVPFVADRCEGPEWREKAGTAQSAAPGRQVYDAGQIVVFVPVEVPDVEVPWLLCVVCWSRHRRGLDGRL